MSITIIGCGWLGLPLGKRLVNQGYKVFGSIRKESSFGLLKDDGIHPFALDLDESSQVPDTVIEATTILVISLPPLHRDNPQKYAAQLNELLHQFPESVRVIFTSSTGIYPQVANRFEESFEFNSMQDSTVLNVAENVIRSTKLQSTIFRLGGLIGPNRHPIRFLQGRENVKNPDGPINFVHLEDCIRAILLSIENTDFSGVFNVVFPDYPSRKDYYTKAARHYQLTPPNFREENEIRRIISSEKIIQESGFTFKFPIDVFPEIDLN